MSLPIIFTILLISAVIMQTILSERKKKKKREEQLIAEQEQRIAKRAQLILQIEQLYAEGKIWESDKAQLINTVDSPFSYKIDSRIQYAVSSKLHYEVLYGKYSLEIADKLFKEEYWIGMSKEQLMDSKGKPDKTEVEVLKTKTKETWIYGNKNSGDYFVFENDLATKIVDR